ncbi:hypothetical protein F0U44_06365 [Nocardioides humilatus]|uniref:Mce-associated membrane protein n=1 Tax=Nocardioides humilatus TaxID=2607660 RepID=A0A5B1LQK8_9ACTN|nr:hypothetical protein [Nocardioides humilatus]KAA1421887.1 hypothetical protein F0U44_06365 [Nocardioides humilatus]
MITATEEKTAPTVKVSRLEPSLKLGPASFGWRWWLAPLVLAAVAATLFVVNGRHDVDLESGDQARAAVVGHVEELLSYDYRTIGDEAGDEGKWLTGSFADDYAALVTDEIAPAAQKVKVTTEASVSASGVVSADGDEVELLLFVTVTTRSSELAEPRITGSRLVVTAKNVDGDWLISALDPV